MPTNDNPTETPINKFAKLTILTFIGMVFFFILLNNFDFLRDANIFLFPLQSWGNWDLSGILFWSSFVGFFILIAFVSIFGIIAFIQTYKNKERGGIVSLLLTGVSILFLISIASIFSFN